MDRKKIQLLLALAILAAGLRLAWILYRRHEESRARPRPPSAAAPAILSSDYADVPQSGVYDAASARQLVGKTVWIKLGYSSPAYPVAAGRVLAHAGVPLPPLTPLRIAGVLRQRWQGRPTVFYTFHYSGRLRAVPIGVEAAYGSAQMQVDTLFFIANPRQIYHFWPAKTWSLISHHQVAVGMSDTQVMLALGGAESLSLGSARQSYLFPGVHPPMEVTFSNRRVVSFHPQKSPP